MSGSDIKLSHMSGHFRSEGVAIRGVVSAVPGIRIGNDYFNAKFGGDSVAGVTKMTGIQSRYWVGEDQTTADLCYVAAERLIEQLGWERGSVDALIFVSQTPDYILPATACVLQSRLGLPTTVAAFDVNLGCSGYVYGLWLASSLVRGGCRRVILLAGDTISRIVDPEDRGTVMLFGDAGSATAIEAESTASPGFYSLGSDGSGAEYLKIACGNRSLSRNDKAASDTLYMEGSEIFNFTVSRIPELISATLEAEIKKTEDIDYYIFHQANTFIIKYIAKKLNVDMSRVPVNIGQFGNTSSASIPLVMTSMLAEPLIQKPTRLMLTGFGVGYSWAAAALELSPMTCVETIYL